MKPLGDIRVLDLSRVVSGPFCTMQLADMGADVIKVEEPGRGDDSRAFGPPFRGGESAYYLSVNRNKRSLALDLKREEALAVLRPLIEASDVLVENFRPGTADRLGLGYEAASALNPRIVYCSISGFGADGPERDRPGYDLTVQGASGIMDVTGTADGPPTKVGTSIADLVTGLYAAQGILLALRAREATGAGQRVDIAMIDAMASLLTFNAGIFFESGRSPVRRGNAHPSIVPYEAFEASDGWLNLAVANDALFGRFREACGRPDLLADDRFSSAPGRVAHRELLVPIVAEIIASQPRAFWTERLGAAGVPCGEIRTVGEVCTNEALIGRGVIRDLPHDTLGTVRTIDTPMRLSQTPGGGERAAPRLGQHSREILSELAGLDEPAIERLEAAGVVRLG